MSGYARGGVVAVVPDGSNEVPLWLAGGCDYVLSARVLTPELAADIAASPAP